jgi:isocitrate/isopropylmalate dehydrogenase
MSDQSEWQPLVVIEDEHKFRAAEGNSGEHSCVTAEMSTRCHHLTVSMFGQPVADVRKHDFVITHHRADAVDMSESVMRHSFRHRRGDVPSLMAPSSTLVDQATQVLTTSPPRFSFVTAGS